MRLVFEAVFVWLCGALLDKVGRTAAGWLFVLLLVGPLALMIALVWTLI